MNLPDRVLNEIRMFAAKHGILKVVLFGSRASETNTERSDIDIAVTGGNFSEFYCDIQEKIHSLLMFDVINIDGGISETLRDEVRNGVVIYEKS